MPRARRRVVLSVVYCNFIIGSLKLRKRVQLIASFLNCNYIFFHHSDNVERFLVSITFYKVTMYETSGTLLVCHSKTQLTYSDLNFRIFNYLPCNVKNTDASD